MVCSACEIFEWLGVCAILEWLGVCEVLEWFGVCEVLEWFGVCEDLEWLCGSGRKVGEAVGPPSYLFEKVLERFEELKLVV